MSIESRPIDNDVLPDVLEPGLRLVICGTAVGERSALVGAYYAGPSNQFWDTLFSIGLTPKRLSPREYSSLPAYGIGLTDIAKSVTGVDRGLRLSDSSPRALHRKMLHHQPGILVFNGKKAASLYFGMSTKEIGYGLQNSSIDATRLFVAPSTSGSARKYWDIRWWWKIADLVE